MIARGFKLGIVAVEGVLLAVACASLGEAEGPDGGVCHSPSCEPVDAATDKQLPETSVPDSGGPDAPALVNPLCGAMTECIADIGKRSACEEHRPADAGVGSEAGALDDAGDGAPRFSPPGTGADAGPPAPDAEPFYDLGCYVTRGSDDQPVQQCLPAGTGKTGAPCVGSADCAAGYACIGDANAAQCRPYCCGDPEACPSGTFCAEREQRDGELTVPVCVQADNCNLAEQYPCPAGSTCTCKGDTACMVVRDKTTSCVVPGTGKVGESCPCAWGYICSKAIDQCLKLCSLGSSTGECGTQTCTQAAFLPSGWGICAQ